MLQVYGAEQLAAGAEKQFISDNSYTESVPRHGSGAAEGLCKNLQYTGVKVRRNAIPGTEI